MAVTPRATDDAECPLIDLEVMCEPEGARTQRGVTVGSQTIEHGRRSGA